MKRLFPILVLLFALVALAPGHVPAATARAEGEQYAVAAARDVWFYSEADENKGLFILPYTYYVKVLSEGDPFCYVEYQDASDGYKPLTGYCRRDALTFVDFQPTRPFLKKRITLTYSIDSGSGFGGGAFDSIERTVSFYGTFASGTAPYYYVYGDGEFGYVRATTPVSYDLNTDYLTPASGDDPEPPTTSANKGINGVEIALVCLLCVAAVIVAFFVIKGKKPPVANRDQDD
ncbi:MAG: hypothetical protein K2H43_05635 [Clostridia bacterium]|nr:hypothetical protein [Clostridia bacterium]